MIVYRFITRCGAFMLIPDERGWMVWFGDDCIDGPYASPQTAAQEIAGGHCAWPSCGDPSLLSIPEDLSEWECGRHE